MLAREYCSRAVGLDCFSRAFRQAAWLGLFFSAIMPYILPLAVLDMGLAYAIDKYNVLRVYKRPAHTSSNLSQALLTALCG